MFNGLRKRPTYEDISQEINPDKTKVIYPNRDAKFLREDPRMTQMDGVGFFESMKDQEEATIKEQRKETTMRQMANDSGEGMAETKINRGIQTLKAKTKTQSTQANATEPMTQTFNIARDDDLAEEHETELAEKETIRKGRIQVKKDKMKQYLQKIL